MTAEEPLITVSVTEVMSFRECRRKWYLFDVLNMHPKVEAPYFWLGKGIHKALEEFWEPANFGLDRGERMQRALDAFRMWYIKSTDELAKEYGADLWTDDMAKDYFTTYMNGLQQIAFYVQFDYESADLGEPVSVELRVRVPIFETEAGSDVYTNEAVLSAQTDLVTQVKGAKGVKIVDHKAMKQKWSTGEVLDIDEQLTGYGYSHYRDTGEMASDLVYDTLMTGKEMPGWPDINKDGSLSVNRQQKTVWYLYKMKAEELKIDLNGAKYIEYVEFLKQKGWSDYFYREHTQRNYMQLYNYERRLRYTVREMIAVKADPELAFPSPGAMKCSLCPYISVCHAMEDGGDGEALLQARFKHEVRAK